jgi:hypothetical protein
VYGDADRVVQRSVVAGTHQRVDTRRVQANDVSERWRSSAAVAAVVYLALACWSVRGLWDDPAGSYVAEPFAHGNPIADSDQAYMVWATSRNVRTLLHRPSALRDAEQCHPLTAAAGLAHPLFADGVHAVPLYLLGLPPVLLLNVLSLLVLWASALTMYALAWHWTHHGAAAFLAGAAFAFQPLAVFSSRWPGILGDVWGPVLLLCAHRLFARGGWWDAIGLAVAVVLQTLGSFYQLVPTAVTALAYLSWLAIRHRDRLRATIPKLVPAAAGVVVAAWLQFSPAVAVRGAWGTIVGHPSVLVTAARYLPGTPSQPGTIVLLLAIVALLDRVVCRRTRDGDDPRLVHLAMGLLALGMVTSGFAVPGTAWFVPSLVSLLLRLPGFDAVRGLGLGRPTVHLSCALLAAYGVVAIAARLPAGWRMLAPLALACAVVVENVVPAVATSSFGVAPLLETRPLAPPSPALRALYARTVQGAVVDLLPCSPYGFGCRAHYLVHAAYHEHPTAVCIGSYDSPLTEQIDALANRLPDGAAADALGALGFATIVVHTEDGSNFTRAREEALLRAGARFPLLGIADGHAVHALRPPTAVTEEPAVLVPSNDDALQTLAPDASAVLFHIRNASGATYRQTDPIEPTWLSVTWTRDDGTQVSQARVRALLPIALAAGAEQAVTIPTPMPSEPGTYQVAIARDAVPDRTFSRTRVQVRAAP